MLNWRDNCKIIPEYMPPYPGKNTKPSCVVFHSETDSFLRFENGTESFRSPNSSSENYFWDMYGTDFQTIENAKEALNNASEPIGKPYIEFTIKSSRK